MTSFSAHADGIVNGDDLGIWGKEQALGWLAALRTISRAPIAIPRRGITLI